MGKEIAAEEILRQWNGCHGAFYRVHEADLRWNLGTQSLLRYWTAPVAGVPALWAEASPAGVALGIAPENLWLSLHGEIAPGQEAAFAAAAEEFARARGTQRLFLLGEEFHFLPGLPAETPAELAVVEAFRARGFSAADSADFVGAPANEQSAAYVAEARAELEARGWSFGGAEGAEEELDAFLLREFPGRWHREWRAWRARPAPRVAFWNLLRDERGAVLGFSRLALRGPAGEWTPGALRLPLSPEGARTHTDSCLGPIGISRAERGRGAGKVLLGISLHELSLRGAKLTCIDWTNAYNYYTPLGFRIVRRYFSVRKELKL